MSIQPNDSQSSLDWATQIFGNCSWLFTINQSIFIPPKNFKSLIRSAEHGGLSCTSKNQKLQVLISIRCSYN